MGTGSNADAVGARVHLNAGGPHADSGGAAQDRATCLWTALRWEFGIGTAVMVDEIEVRWPSGRIQVIEDVPADQVVEIEEPGS